MDINTYQKQATKKLTYPRSTKTIANLFLVSKITEETGELAKEMVKEAEYGTASQVNLTSELGDMLWVIAAFCTENGIQMSDVIGMNLAKLKERNLL